jgi:hypothetical protein
MFELVRLDCSQMREFGVFADNHQSLVHFHSGESVGVVDVGWVFPRTLSEC